VFCLRNPTSARNSIQVAPADEISLSIQVTAAPASSPRCGTRLPTYLFGAALAMMADNIEHVITYWVLWQKFHSRRWPASRS